MPPNSSGAPPPLLKPSMRRTGPPIAGSSGTPSAVQRSEFEDFMNAYRPTLENLPLREHPPPPRPAAEESGKSDFGRSIKKLMKRPQGSPGTQSKNHRKEGVQRTPTVVVGYPDFERGAIVRDSRQQQSQKPKRPLSANIDSYEHLFAPQASNIDSYDHLFPPQAAFGQGPTVLLPLDANLSRSEVPPPTPPVSPQTKTPKSSVHQAPASTPQAAKGSKPPQPAQQQAPTASSQTKAATPKTSIQQPPASPKPPTPSQQQQALAAPTKTAASTTKTASSIQQQAAPPASPHQPKTTSKSTKSSTKNGPPDSDLVFKFPPEAGVSGAGALSGAQAVPGKKVSIQEEKRRSGTEGSSSDAHCLIITGNNIGRFLPPRHNPDPILNMRMVHVPERKYHIILEFEECSQPPVPPQSTSGLMVITPEEPVDTREQQSFFSWIRESHVAPMGMLLMNVERLTELPFLTYLVVGGGQQELAQKLQFVGERPVLSRRNLRFLAGYEEPVTITRPPASAFPEKPSQPDKTGFVIALYQVLEGDDGVRFEQNWVMWTGARQIYRTLPHYMGLKRISVHKSVIPTKTINYVLMCEFSNIMDHLTDACVIVDHLRARCCGFIGIYRILDSL